MFSKEILNIEKQKALPTEAIPNFQNDPSFIKAKERAYEILKEAPLPDFILKKLANSDPA